MRHEPDQSYLDQLLFARRGGEWFTMNLVPTRDYVEILAVRAIALRTIKMFLKRGESVADASEPVMAWFRQVRQADWAKPADVNRDIRSASILKDGRVVFYVAGNKYRIVAWINYPYRVVYIRFVGGHRQYDAIDAQTM